MLFINLPSLISFNLQKLTFGLLGKDKKSGEVRIFLQSALVCFCCWKAETLVKSSDRKIFQKKENRYWRALNKETFFYRRAADQPPLPSI